MARLTVINRVSGAARFPRAAVSAALGRAELIWPKQIRGRTVAAVLVSKAESKRLNQAHRGQNKATNVLSFVASEAGELGDIIICFEVAVREAKTGRQKISERIIYLFTHGLLHLLGFDHQTGRETRSWARAEKKLLTIKAE